MVDAQTSDLGLGCLFGAFLGDAMGVYLEGRGDLPSPLDVLKASEMIGGGVLAVAPGQITDDSELALSLARGLIYGNSNLKKNPVIPLNNIAREYVRWFRSDPFDVGNTCKKTLSSANKYPLTSIETKTKKLWADCLRNTAQRETNESKSNGSLMRCTPWALWAHKLSTKEQGYCGYNDSLMTHSNETTCIAEGSYVISCSHLITHPKDVEGAIQAAVDWITSENTESEVLTWIEEAKEGKLTLALNHIGFSKHAYVRAFYCLLNRKTYMEAMKDTLAAGGDTDTNAAIVGGLLGAYHGLNEIPEELITKLTNCDTTKGRPRPEIFQTKNLKEIGETLLRISPESIQEFPWRVGQPLDFSKYINNQ